MAVAEAAGAVHIMDVADMPYGDRQRRRPRSFGQHLVGVRSD